MPTTHTVGQGETLTRIASQYKYSSWKKLYEHPDNAEFRNLRSDPNLIFPGDKIIIPDPTPKKSSARSGRAHVFCLKREKEVYRVKIQNKKGKAWEGKRVVLNMAGQSIDSTIGPDGVIEVELPGGNE